MTATHVRGRFLDPALCRAVVAELEQVAVWQWGQITRDGRVQVDADFRRAQWCNVPPSCESVVAGRLLAIGRGLASAFGPLRSFEGPNVLRYRPGDFFRPHPDEDPKTRVRPRRVTITAFLNDGGFDGGVLRMWPPGRRPVEIPATAGGFVAFPARTVHEVTAVAGGNRYALVAWMH
jgi:predicted 2-oxoglutarate/Fe(II)-dependent dioxygenase YbiX